MGRLVPLALACGIVAIAILRASLPLLGTWLIVSDPLPERIDMLFTFAGPRMRVDYSRQILSLHPQAHWVLSDPRKRFANAFSEWGIDPEECTVIPPCTSTREEMEALFQFICRRATGDGKAELELGLVSEPFHMRRIKCYATALRRSLCRPVNISCLPIPRERFVEKENPYGRWWMNRRLRRFAQEELFKIPFCLLG